MSGSLNLRNWIVIGDQLRPYKPPVIWPKITASDLAPCLALNSYRQLLTACFLAVANIPNMRPGCSTAPGELVALTVIELECVRFEIHASNDTPCGVYFQHRMVNFGALNRLV